MQEEFLHYVWQFKKFNTTQLKTSAGEELVLIHPGNHNLNGGPDFFNAKLKINDQLWAGNVEIHINASDWYVHGHEIDPAYDNVILHVVYDHNTDIFRKNNSLIPTLELKDLIDQRVLANYNRLLMTPHKWINCENDFANVDDFVLSHWLERLYIERLQRKSQEIDELLISSKNDYEGVLFKLLAKNFGLKVNGDAFMSMAKSFDFSVIRKIQNQPLQMEALMMGQSGLLNTNVQDAYYQEIVKAYEFLKQKFNLSDSGVIPMQFFRLRPPNFPTIRISQLATLYHQHINLFAKVMNADSIITFYEIFHVGTSEFWTTHFTFQKKSNISKKILTKSFIDLLLINTILPLRFSYSKHHGNLESESLLAMAREISSEQNGIVKAFHNLAPISSSALTSQALIQLKTEYCDKNRCVKCAIGNSIINK